jgi:hypothetical protein
VRTGRRVPVSGRILTPEEEQILQGFPLDYPFRGTAGQRALQIGNAVPPALARAVVEAMIVGWDACMVPGPEAIRAIEGRNPNLHILTPATDLDVTSAIIGWTNTPTRTEGLPVLVYSYAKIRHLMMGYLEAMGVGQKEGAWEEAVFDEANGWVDALVQGLSYGDRDHDRTRPEVWGEGDLSLLEDQDRSGVVSDLEDQAFNFAVYGPDPEVHGPPSSSSGARLEQEAALADLARWLDDL